MSTGKEIAARVAAEFGGVKPWGDRAAEVPDGAIVTSLHISSFMQAEIDELRTENARLRDVLGMATTALLEHGSPFFGCELRYADAIKAARAALGES